MGWLESDFACIQGTIRNSSRKSVSSELAEDDGDDEKDKDGDDGDGDYPVRSHPATSLDPCSSIVTVRGEAGKVQYLRAIPLSVLTLRST